MFLELMMVCLLEDTIHLSASKKDILIIAQTCEGAKFRMGVTLKELELVPMDEVPKIIDKNNPIIQL